MRPPGSARRTGPEAVERAGFDDSPSEPPRAVAETIETIEDVRHPHPVFAHASEAEMARILDFYQVRWEYEPHTFPIQWNLEGAVVESFSPDFWLPDLDLYLEMTTLRQKLVRKKNRKLRRVLGLYPDLRVKLFYARDFRALMLKFGKYGLVDEISGTPGQVVPQPTEPEASA
jgi:hypoxanthine phosphoribosyltransferase